jgi:hypothetical protein
LIRKPVGAVGTGVPVSGGIGHVSPLIPCRVTGEQLAGERGRTEVLLWYT